MSDPTMDDEANVFAMELLMPREWLLADISKSGFDINDQRALARLAEKYGVSVALMALRIGQLWLRALPPG